MSSAYFEPESSFQEDGCIYRHGWICLHAEITINGFYSNNSVLERTAQNYTLRVTWAYHVHYD
jgi:hypothetical protein